MMPGFKPVSEISRLSDKVYDQIYKAILDGVYPTGSKLPSENEFAEVFNVSRTSVREAMKMLSGRGLINVKRGLGSYVAQGKERTYANDLQSILSRERENILELVQIRKILETEAAAWAAIKAQPDEIESMERILEEAVAMTKAPGYTRAKLNQINSEFHYLLIKSTGNRTLLKVMASLMDMLTEVRDITLQLPGRNIASVAGHRELLDAIREHDPDRARVAMAKHLEAVETIVNKS